MQSRELMKKIALGEREALKEFLALYGGKIFRAAQSVLRDKSLSEDVLSEIALKIWQCADKFQKIENIVGYLCSAAYNRAVDIKRKSGREVFGLDLSFRESPSSDSAEKICVSSALEKMEEPYRGVLIMRGACGMGFRDIAKAKNMPYHTVRRVYAEACRIFEKLYNGE